MATEITGYLLRYGVPCAYSLIVLLGYVFNLNMARNATVYRWLPVGGFPDDPAGTLQVTYWNTEITILRERLKVQAIPRWGGIFIAGLPVMACIAAGQFGVAVGAVLVVGGIAAAVHFWKKSRRPDEQRVCFDWMFGWIWT